METTVDLRRVFDAPAQRVFEAWTRAEQLSRIACSADDDKGVKRLDEVIDVSFAERAGRTTLTLNAVASGPSVEAQNMLKGMKQGWSQTVHRLDGHLKET